MIITKLLHILYLLYLKFKKMTLKKKIIMKIFSNQIIIVLTEISGKSVIMYMYIM